MTKAIVFAFALAVACQTCAATTNLLANKTLLDANLYATKLNVVSALTSTLNATLGKDATVDLSKPRLTGTLTCYIDNATGNVVGLRLGTAPALCSAAGTPRSFVVPDDAHVAALKVATDKVTGGVGELVFVIASNSTAAQLPTSVVTCGTQGGLAVDVMPPLSALADVAVTCRAAPNGRRLQQQQDPAPGQALDPTGLKVTVTTLTAPSSPPPPPPPPPPPTPPPSQFTWIRWTITQRRGTANSVQAAELQFQLAGTTIASQFTGVTATNPGGQSPNGEGPPQGHDNNLATKWLDFNFGSGTTGNSVYILQFASPPVFDSYSWYTANDTPARDPVTWTLEGSNDGSTYTLLDTQTNYAVTTTRQALVGPFAV